uniref:Cell division FtsK/SpoIIIE n=1 Tax=uncultured Chloroflexota bacterium TaxID=166587 RepID=H5SF20_9CHLR|nr:cell division FtsK/SpoIIIE [uncultured Chloroflexota bacterium]
MPASPALVPRLSWWRGLSPERRLDLIGALLLAAGVLFLASWLAAVQSGWGGGGLRLAAQLFGWGVYLLPLFLMLFGIWLILRRVERIPALSPERALGSFLFFLWVLTLFHAAVADPQMAEIAAQNGMGGGYLGSLLQRLLWFTLGEAGAWVVLVAWGIGNLILLLEKDLRFLLGLLATPLARLWTFLRQHLRKPRTVPPTVDVAANGFTPLPPRQEGEPITVPAPLPAVMPLSGTATITWQLPSPGEILDKGQTPTVNEEFIERRARLIEETLASLGAPGQVVEISRGPSVTLFGVEPLFLETRGGRIRVRVSKIAALADDLALALAAPRIRIQAPVPGRSYVGIEVPNEEMTLVTLREIVESEVFQRNRTPLRFALGRDVAGRPVVADLENMPHLLIAGTTGSGKSVCVNAILTCLLLHNTPDELRLVLVDPKRVELSGYNGIPHLLAPVVVEMDRVVGTLQWMAREMDRRYQQFAQLGARNIHDYNARMKLQGGKKLPYLVIVVDELADLMMIAPEETERVITRLAQLARATGIHLILATQRPSVDVVTGLIKANFPARIAFAVASGVDSRVILDQPGAERLLGRGDMLYQAPDAPSPLRLQGVFVSDAEIQRLTEFWRSQAQQVSAYAVSNLEPGKLPPVPLKQAPLWEDFAPPEEPQGDPLLEDAIEFVRREGRASISMLQRRFRIGYTRAARLIDQMENQGIVGPPEGMTQVRKVLDYGPLAPPKDEGM